MQAQTPEVSAEKATTDDPLYPAAVALVVQHRRGSITFIQRHLRIGYWRAAGLLQALETAGIISVMSNDGTRTVLVPEVPNVLPRN